MNGGFLFFGVIAALGLAFVAGVKVALNHICDEAVIRGLARYNPMTKAFEWLDPPHISISDRRYER